MVDTISFDDVLPEDTSIYDPLVRPKFEKLISFYECHKKLDESYKPLEGKQPYHYDPNCSLHTNFSLSVVNIAPFIEPFKDPIIFRMASIFAFGRQLQNSIKSEVCRRVSAVGELLAPLIPNSVVGVEEARKCLVATVRRLICYTSLYSVTNITKEHIMEATSHRGLLAAFKDDTEWPEFIPARYKTAFINSEGKSTLTPELAMKLLQLMAIHSDEEYEEIIQISHLQVALTTKDDEDPTFLCEVADYLIRKCSERTTIDQDLVKAMRATFTELCNTKIAFRVFAVWSEIFPGQDTKVRRTFKEALKTKIICLYTIKKAFQTFPEFRWKHLCDIPEYGEEIINIAEAMMVLEKEPFCGFDKEFYPVIGPTQFPNFAAACRDLLIRGKGCIYLQSFADFKTIPAEDDKVIEMIENYCSGVKLEKFKGKLTKEIAVALYIVQDIARNGKFGIFL